MLLHLNEEAGKINKIVPEILGIKSEVTNAALVITNYRSSKTAAFNHSSHVIHFIKTDIATTESSTKDFPDSRNTDANNIECQIVYRLPLTIIQPKHMHT